MSTNHDVLVVSYAGRLIPGLVEALETTGSRVRAIDLDRTASPEAVRHRVAAHLHSHGAPSALIHLLPSHESQPRAELVTNTEVQAAVEGGLTHALVTCQEVGRAMLSTGAGTIVFVLAGEPGGALTTVTDTAVLGLMRVLAVEWASSQVRVVAASPQGVPDHGRDEAIAKTVEFLVSDDASYITGTTVAIRARVETH